MSEADLTGACPMEYLSCEMFTPLNAEPIYLGRSLFLWDGVNSFGVPRTTKGLVGAELEERRLKWAVMKNIIAKISFFSFILYTLGIAHAGELEKKLFDAAFMGKVEIARDLIAQGADVNARDEMGNPVLLTAVRPYGEKMVRLLVESGADVNAAGSLEDTPLINASRTELTKIVRILLDAGSDPNIARSDGSTALMEACVFGHTEFVKLLVEQGADISAKDQFGLATDRS